MSKPEKNPTKRLISVRDDLLDEVYRASVKEDTTATKFVEEAIKYALKISQFGVESSRLVELCEVMQTYRTLGGVFVPRDVLDFLISKACRDSKEPLHVQWYEAGLWYGKFLREKFSDPVQAFKSFLEVTRWDLNEVDLIRDRQGEFVKLRFISTLLSNEETVFLVKFVEGVMSSLGYRVVNCDHMRGIAAVEFKK
ncbi:MAG: hypothetical protein N3D85_03675 [Candidatus Bathyarchaeota archaeon]|nr:hypothetical protein [Candidatus Bathyarchaeota archaeon]